MATDIGELSRLNRADAAGDRPAVQIAGLHRTFAPIKTKGGAGGVLKSLDLEIKQGEFVALLGRSGSGKSTRQRRDDLITAHSDCVWVKLL